LSSLISMPLLIARLEASLAIYMSVAGMILLTVVKRLEANRRPLPPPGVDRWKVVIRRLLLDRDIQDHQEWIRRKPNLS
jgi:hypothetical protein